MTATTSQTTNTERFSLQPIIGVKRKTWRSDDEHAELANEEFSSTRKQVLERDNYTCTFCGFRASKYQEVHHKDDDHRNNETGNLITACTLCHQVHHLGMFSMRNAGFIAAIPELTQTEINHICRYIHVASLFSEKEEVDKLQGILTLLKSRGSDTLKRAFNCDLSDPYLLTQILSGGDEEFYVNREKLLVDLRLVSTVNAFHAGQLEYYAKECRTVFMPSAWASLGRLLLGDSR